MKETRTLTKEEFDKLQSYVINTIKETKEQKLLGKEERMKNILDAFEIKNKEKLFKKNILLIDDVYTTGATINECKKNIDKCNINKIYLLTIAKSNI